MDPVEQALQGPSASGLGRVDCRRGPARVGGFRLCPVCVGSIPSGSCPCWSIPSVSGLRWVDSVRVLSVLVDTVCVRSELGDAVCVPSSDAISVCVPSALTERALRPWHAQRRALIARQATAKAEL